MALTRLGGANAITGVIPTSVAPGQGKILQVSSQVRNTSQQTIATTTYTDLTSLSIAITPSSTSSKILLKCFVHGVMYVFQPLNTTDGVTAGIIHSNSNTNNSAGAQMTVTSFNMPEAGTNSAYTGFQFAASSGNIAGRITVYGITDPA